MKLTRRGFLAGAGKLTGGVAMGLAVLPVIEACLPTSAPIIPIAASNPVGPDGKVAVDVSDITPSHPYKVASGITGPDGMGVLITLTNGTTWHAFSQRCTHASCPVDSQLAGTDIHCSCHNSYFTLEGSVVSGPAPSPLVAYDTTYDAAAKVLQVKLV
ncbi:MAG: Rieske 2Fe-2S domain-containing protein [Bacteroidota bacterium]|nr:Rieske 2Fe-2S domain-containing protein [Bacteroidota bacterium]MDP4233730.1 Rieske 2Fe-2S domain-containing protein [Bacteroidota bacterium]MDP4242369.1 Rieske 2Fe-2S domain-containing protein [Bacteroidota bacterium]MDP4288678.1 Rieske 2Fe-2S domain-containing protein [Bacteroidota bacterium]